MQACDPLLLERLPDIDQQPPQDPANRRNHPLSLLMQTKGTVISGKNDGACLMTTETSGRRRSEERRVKGKGVRGEGRGVEG